MVIVAVGGSASRGNFLSDQMLKILAQRFEQKSAVEAIGIFTFNQEQL